MKRIADTGLVVALLAGDDPAHLGAWDAFPLNALVCLLGQRFGPREHLDDLGPGEPAGQQNSLKLCRADRFLQTEFSLSFLHRRGYPAKPWGAILQRQQ